MADNTEEMEAKVKELQLEVNDLSSILEAIGQGTQKMSRRFIRGN